MDNKQYEQKILEIEKENRILVKKLRRSQTNLAMSEETNDRKESLLNQVICDLRQSESTLALSSQENARLYQQSQKNAQQLQFTLNELKIHEAQVQRQNDQLAKAARLKDEFLATISHELRTPLNGILGYSQILLEEIFGSLNNKQLQSIDQINSCGNHLLSLINDIIELTRIQSELIVVDITPVSIEQLCQDSIEAIKAIAVQKNIALSAIPTNLGTIQVDAKLIQQVLVHLLNNSVKFTPEGGQILLQVLTDPQQQQLQFQVKDTGIGIPEEELENIFDLFYQVDGKLSRNQGGLGLGLAIVKEIVDLHHGSVSVVSMINGGSTFTVSLPYTSTDLNLSLPAINQKSNMPYILIAEDDSWNMEVIVLYLENYGFRFMCVNNGEEALQQAEREQPALILMDIQMPVMDGLEAIKQIRRDPNLAETPIIAITALAMTGDRDRCLAAGANEYLSKPVKLKDLATIILNLLNTD